MKYKVNNRPSNAVPACEIGNGNLFRHIRGSAYYIMFFDRSADCHVGVKIDNAEHYKIDGNKLVVPVEGTLHIEEEE